MKKIFLVLTIFSMVFTSCDPLEDINNEIDAQGPSTIEGTASYTITDKEYKDKVSDGGFGLSFTNFGSEAEAKTMIPAFLANKYPVWGKNSSVNVTFKYYNKVNTYSRNVEKVSSADYVTIEGAGKTSFNSSSDVYKYLKLKYPTPAEGDFRSVSHKLTRSGVTNTLVDGFVYKGSSWSRITGFTKDQYTAMGEFFPNFSSHDEAAIKIPVALLDKFKFSPQDKETITSVMYELYKGSGVTKSYVNNYIFNGTTWTKYNNVFETTVQFGHLGTKWVPDNTIKYTLVTADYTFIHTTYKTKYADQAANMKSYGNFNFQGSSTSWTLEMITDVISGVLLNNNPSAAEGQKYIVTYSVYDGSTHDSTISLILTGGKYIINK